MKTYLVCFDISDDKIRRNVGKLLCQYGDRVQESVFEIMIRSPGQWFSLHKKLKQICQHENNIRFYRLCRHCRKTSHTLQGEKVMYFPAAIIID